MTLLGPTGVYLLCLLTSLVCTGLLVRAYLRARGRLLLWTAIAFGFLSLNNLLLVADMVLLPDIYLWPYRQAATFGALAVMLCGFIWEAEA